MEDNLNFLYMEYILIFLEMEEDLNYFANERWPQLFLWIAEGLKLFVFLMDDASIFFENGIRPQISHKMQNNLSVYGNQGFDIWRP